MIKISNSDEFKLIDYVMISRYRSIKSALTYAEFVTADAMDNNINMAFKTIRIRCGFIDYELAYEFATEDDYIKWHMLYGEI